MTTHIISGSTRNLTPQQVNELGCYTLGQLAIPDDVAKARQALDDGCKLAWQTTAFDEGFFDHLQWSDFASWWPTLLSEWVDEIKQVGDKVGRLPDYLVISTENKQIERDNNRLADMVASFISMVRCVCDADVIAYAGHQPVYSIRDGWQTRSWPWPDGCDWPISCPQLYNVNCPAEFAESVRQARHHDKPIVPWISPDFGMSQPQFANGNINAQVREYDVTLTPQAAAWAAQCVADERRQTYIGPVEAVVLRGTANLDHYIAGLRGEIEQ